MKLETLKEILTFRKLTDTALVVVDRLKIRKDVDFKRRLVDSLETASEFADGLINVLFSDDGRDYEKKYSEHFACVDCGINFEELTPKCVFI